MIYGLQGDTRNAEHMARLDLDAEAVRHNLAYYESLRRLSPDARQRAVQALGMQRDVKSAALATQ